MSEPIVKLPRRAEELLREFPICEPDFEAQARAIEVRLLGETQRFGATSAPEAGISEADLLAAPALGPELGEAEAASAVRASESHEVVERPKSSFTEMARRSVQKQRGDEAEIARELLAATARSRRPSPELIERVRAAGRGAASTTPLPLADAGADEAQRPSGVVARAAAPQQPAASKRVIALGVVGGVMALAAGAVLLLRSGSSEDRTRASLAAARASAAPVARALPTADTKDADSAPGVVTPEALAAAPAETARAEARPPAPRSAAGGAAPGAATPDQLSLARGSASKPEAVVLEDDPEPQKAAAPEAKPAAPSEPPLLPAQGNSTSIPLTPSSGAVSTALSVVRGDAQACLAGQNDAVVATVTFASDGRVLRVGASGPSAACIQAALFKAHLLPFAKDSFTATTTIRPP